MARPRKLESEKYKTPVRQLGRIPDGEWELLKAAAEKSGESFTAWAKKILLRAARRQLKE